MTHLDGHEVEIDHQERITSPQEKIRLKGEGMPVHEVPSQFGDLLVTFSVDFPDRLSGDQIDSIKDIL